MSTTQSARSEPLACAPPTGFEPLNRVNPTQYVPLNHAESVPFELAVAPARRGSIDHTLPHQHPVRCVRMYGI